MSVKQKKICNSIGIVLTLAALMLYVLAMHDMQTAKGIGLYLNMKAGGSDRRFWDVLADGIRLLGLFIFSLLPIACMKSRSVVGICRQILTMLALMPLVNETAMLHFVFEKGINTVRIATDSYEWMIQGRDFFANALLIFPIFLVFVMMNVIEQKQPRKPGLMMGVVIAETVLLAVSLMLPALAPFSAACFWYIVVFFCMVEAERVFAENKKTETAALILYSLFWVRAVYRMVFIMESFRL